MGGGGGRGGFGRPQGPPDYVQAVGNFVHPCKEEAIIKLATADQIPMFNAPIYLENKQQIGKVNEVFGPINQVYISVKLDDGFVSTSYKEGDVFHIAPFSLMAAEKFTAPPPPKAAGGKKGAWPWRSRRRPWWRSWWRSWLQRRSRRRAWLQRWSWRRRPWWFQPRWWPWFQWRSRWRPRFRW